MKLALAVVAIGTLCARAARGDNGYLGAPSENAPIEVDDCPSQASRTAADLTREGHEHYERGQILYEQGDYPAAVQEWVDAYCIQNYFSLLKDVGQAYERDLDYERAVAYFKRFVAEVPRDAETKWQVEKGNIIARIGVLEKLRAQVLVQTEPKDASIAIANDAGVHAVGKSGQKMEVFRGHYTLTIEKPGYESVSQPLVTQIGKPLSVFVKLEPVKGRLALQATPNETRLYIDNNYVGTGHYEDRKIKAGKYALTAEAPGYERSTREIVVLPEQEAHIQVELEAVPQTGRRQAIIAGTIAGAASIGSITNAVSKLGFSGLAGGTLIGAVVGFAGSYFFLPSDIPLGTSSLAITSTMLGYILGTTGAAVFTSDSNVITPLAGATALLAGATGYYIGSETHIRSGDAAVVNTGVVWGATFGFLFAESFNADRRIGSALTLSGLAMGAVGGALSAHYFNVSRSHAALIDLGGVLGIVVGLAGEALAYPTAKVSAQEHISNFAIGGLAIGLVATGFLTRNYDAPTIPIGPAFGTAQTATGASTMTFGVGISF